MIESDPAAVAEIRARIRLKQERYMERDAEGGVLAVWDHGDDICVFDLVSPLFYRGFDALARTTREMVAQSEGPLEIDFSDPQFGEPEVIVSGDLACSWQILHVKIAGADGRRTDIRVRQTNIFNRIDGEWRIVHEHSSQPLDAEQSHQVLGTSTDTIDFSQSTVGE